MLTTIFMPVFIKSLAVTCGIGGGILVSLIGMFLIILALYPITKRFQK